jgi:isoquinoline 1-oxidoreductase beta subunit
VVRPNDTCVIRIAHSEMGQGTLTGLVRRRRAPVRLEKVTTEGLMPGHNLAAKRAWGNMSTGGSQGIRQSQDYVRHDGAAARMMLLQAAADHWQVPVAEVTVEKGIIKHVPSFRQIGYGKVAAAAAKLTPPDLKTIKLKDPNDWRPGMSTMSVVDQSGHRAVKALPWP